MHANPGPALTIAPLLPVWTGNVELVDGWRMWDAGSRLRSFEIRNEMQSTDQASAQTRHSNKTASRTNFLNNGALDV